MKYLLFLCCLIFVTSCITVPKRTLSPSLGTDFINADNEVVIAFGSCNKIDRPNVFWDDILALRPDVFIWGGDNIYADTDDISKMQAMYADQKAVEDYARLRDAVTITGTWDDHDYGKNDGGIEFHAKKGAQQAFLDFMDVPEHSARRQQEGVYSSQVIKKPSGSVKIINLDTRYFRSTLEKNLGKGRRYKINSDPNSTILGEVQWQWLASELENSKADFNLIVTSIQFLSNEHGFEMWANFPHEVKKMNKLLATSKAKGVIFLSGDRHISEFSRTTIAGLGYPLIDFTSSGLTHAYSSFSGELNPYRVGEVVSTTSFGTLRINLQQKSVLFQMHGDGAAVLQELRQGY